MDKFKIFQRFKVLNTWLIAMVCQTGNLFSQENYSYENNFDHSPFQFSSFEENVPVFSPDTDSRWQQNQLSFNSKQQIEPDQLNFKTFNVAENQSSIDHPLNEQGHAISYSFEGNFSAPAKNQASAVTYANSKNEAGLIAQTNLNDQVNSTLNLHDIKPAGFNPASSNSQPSAATVPFKNSDPVESIDRMDPTLNTPSAPALNPGTRPATTAPLSPLTNVPDSTPSNAQTLSNPALKSIPSSTPAKPSTVITNPATPVNSRALEEISTNFNNISMIEYIRFISRISNKNFIFDDENLQFNVTIISEEPTTIQNLMAALLQELKIRDLSLIEQGNNIIIHRNPRIRAPAKIVSMGTELESTHDSELVTRVFRLNTLDPIKASEVIRPLLSEDALVEVLKDTNNLIITDLVTNVNKIAQLIATLDSPNSGVTIGQYVVRNTFVDSLVDLSGKILQPIAQGNPFVLVPHPATNSIFVVSNSFIVEKALAILQNIDMNEGRTKILSLEGLQPTYPTGEDNQQNGNNPFNPNNRPGQNGYNPEGLPDSYGNREKPISIPGGIGSEGKSSAIFDEGREFLPGGIGNSTRWSRDLPVGHIERTLFFIYKLRYRKGDQIEIALRKIGNSLQLAGTANADLISAINSSQWIESSNALIFTGTAVALDKVRELVIEVDTPLRQVFIEMLILDTTIDDSLSYSVDWINRFGGGNTTGEEGFLSNVNAPSNNNFKNAAETIFSAGSTAPRSDIPLLPVATGLLNSGGFAAGIIGTHLTHHGTLFSSIGSLVRAIHTDAKANILLNPKVITEDNNTAEIFVGGTDRYKTQSITNDLGTLVTNNFQFIDVGTTLRVTPLIGNNGIITLEIIQETTSPAATANATASLNQQDVNLVEVLRKTRTVTKIHVPNGFFVILSGMIHSTDTRSYSRIPCLGGIPIIGGFGKSQTTNDNKRNLMLFIRPLIIDNEEDLEDVTRRQQDVYREKCKFRRAWNYEIDESLNFLNIKPTDPDEVGCGAQAAQVR